MLTKIKKTKIKKIPKLRFSGFSGEWEEKKLEDISIFFKGRGISKSDIDKKGKNKCIRYGELYTEYNEIIDEIKSRTNFSKDKSRLSKEDDLLIPSSGETSLDIATISCLKKKNVFLGGDINIVRLKSKNDGGFFAYYLSNFQKRNIARFAQGHSVVHLYSSHFKNLDIRIPDFTEQQKIAEFLEIVDEWIENLQSQKESLEVYKKGIMQKIFSQEIRFKDDKGKYFPEWEEKRFDEVCDIKKGKQLNRIELSISKGYPVINGGINPSGYTNTFNTKGNTITISEGGNSCGFVNFIKKDFWSGGHCYTLLDLSKSIDIIFIYQYLKFLEKNIMRLRVGSGLPNIQKKDIEKLKLYLPFLSEQQKIADFLISSDNLIESKQEQIEKAKMWKKGLMRELFI